MISEPVQAATGQVGKPIRVHAGDRSVRVTDPDADRSPVALDGVLVAGVVRIDRPHLDRVDPVIGAVIPEPNRDHPEDAVPQIATEVVGDLLGDQDRSVTLNRNPRVVTDDPLGNRTRARGRWRCKD